MMSKAITAPELLPSTVVVRVSQGNFEPSQFPEIETLLKRQAEYLVPAIKKLPGLIHWYTTISPEGAMTQISIWDSNEHASAMSTLREMTVTAREEMAALNVSFVPIVNYLVVWTI